MRLGRLLSRNLLYYWRTNLAVLAGVATAVAVLSGALLVGQSVRESLRNLLLQRLGATEYVVSADRFFPEDLAERLSSDGELKYPEEACPIISLKGVVVNESSGARAYEVNVYGVDDRFWKFQEKADRKFPAGRTALVGEALARSLGIREGGNLLLRVESQRGVPRESLFGRRENVGRTVRLVCSGILAPEKLGEFALRPGQGTVYSMFLPLERLQRDLGQPARANALLLAPKSRQIDFRKLRKLLKEKITLRDAGVNLRSLASPPGIDIESSRVLLDESIAQSAFRAAAETGLKASGVFTYLANSIRIGNREIPYSVITAADLWRGAMNSIRLVEGLPASNPASAGDDSIWLNEWAWRDLKGAVGETVAIDYYRWLDEGRLVTQTARFRLAGAVSIGGDVGPALAPDFPGITEARSIGAWDPPFPLDLGRIRPRDEGYWNRYQATPKAFVTLSRGQQLWQSRFGKLSSVRVAFQEGMNPDSERERFARSLRGGLDPEYSGFAVTEVREQGLAASRGSTDFGEYFVYFSFFLIAAAVLLSALFFRLGVEQRVREIGTLQALGFSRGMLQVLFLFEGAILSIVGSLIGLAAAVGYSGLLILTLRTWWIDAVGTNRIYLHLSLADLALGSFAGALVSLSVVALTIRGFRRSSPRALLTGVLPSNAISPRRVRLLGILSALALLSALLLVFGSALGKIPDVAGFFGAGLLLLVSMLSLTALYLRRSHPGLISGHGLPAFFRLGLRNAMHRPGRSLLCIALIASATFVIVSVEAFRQDPRKVSLAPDSGTGGYPLVASSALPLVSDPNSAAGRDVLGIPAAEVPELAQVKFVPFRERPGDDASCLNLYAPQEPRILGASHSFLSAGRFSFQDSMTSTPEHKQNPWLMLESRLEDGSIPAIGDANTIQYILHLSIGSYITVRAGNGLPVRLRLVAALRDSILQGELVISEANFLSAFPEQEGFRFFLLDVPPALADALVQPLMERLADWGFNVESSRARLAAYHRVENTYLSTFQSLGALGLILGTAGLATVLLRNVLERRKELALMRAVGYRRKVLSSIIVAENAVLMICGLAWGTLCALIAILPALHARGSSIPLAMIALILAAVLIVGLTSSLLAVVAAFRSPLLDALRSE